MYPSYFLFCMHLMCDNIMWSQEADCQIIFLIWLDVWHKTICIFMTVLKWYPAVCMSMSFYILTCFYFPIHSCCC